ncbi:MAG TPA: hypothetical protein VLN57_05180 [Xanthobacteraceae bacterium]|nr:hypothetical protein [Xanthobacteraceae bacterium]
MEGGNLAEALRVTKDLRQELREKGLKGFKRGGTVKTTGVAQVHKGERVLTAKQAKTPAVKRALRAPAGDIGSLITRRR